MDPLWAMEGEGFYEGAGEADGEPFLEIVASHLIKGAGKEEGAVNPTIALAGVLEYVNEWRDALGVPEPSSGLEEVRAHALQTVQQGLDAVAPSALFGSSSVFEGMRSAFAPVLGGSSAAETPANTDATATATIAVDEPSAAVVDARTASPTAAS